MVIKQVYTLLNNVSAEMFGNEAISVVASQDVVSLGNTILSSDTSKENFLNTLVDRIGKTVIGQRKYAPALNSIMMDAFSFGAVLQKTYVDIMDATESKHWNLQDGQAVDQFLITKPTVKQKLFSGITTWEIDITIPDFQLKTAFTSASEMATFIASIFTAVDNSLEVKKEASVKMAINYFIASKLCYATKPGYTRKGVVNLLSDYNTLTGEVLTADEAMRNKDFLKYSSMTISLYMERIKTISTLFNEEEYKRFTPKEKQKIMMLSNFSKALTYYLESDTYHAEMVALPTFSEVSFWQGSGTDYGFTNCSKIKMNVKYNGATKTVEQGGIVAVLMDSEAIGVTLKDARTKSSYNSRGEYTNYFNKADIGYFNDLSENGIIFVVADGLEVPVDAQ